MRRLIFILMLFGCHSLASDSTASTNSAEVILQSAHVGFTSYVARAKADLKAGTLPQPDMPPPGKGDVYVAPFGWIAPSQLDSYLTFQPHELIEYTMKDGAIWARVVFTSKVKYGIWTSKTPVKYLVIMDRDSNGEWTPRVDPRCISPPEDIFGSQPINGSTSNSSNKAMQATPQ